MTKAEEHDIFDIPAELASGSLKYVEYIVVNGHPFVLVKDYKNSGAGRTLIACKVPTTARDYGLSEDVTSYLERYGLHPVTKWAKTYQKRVWFAYFSIEKAVPRRGKMFGRSKKLRAKDRK